MSKENESVAFACRITLGDEESMHALRSAKYGEKISFNLICHGGKIAEMLFTF
jgi:hypothetical protein